MAKENAAPPTKKSAKTTMLLVGVCGLLALGAGGAVPVFLMGKSSDHGHGKDTGKHNSSVKHSYVPFGDVVVNLNEDRLTRYLKVKVLLVADARDEKHLTELIQTRKPALKNWLLGHLADKSLQEVSGASGVNKLRREIWHEFNKELFPDGSEKVLDIFFEEFVVQ